MTLVERDALMSQARGENKPLPSGVMTGLSGLQASKRQAERAG